MRFIHLIACFIRASFQEEAAYRANFLIHLFYSILNLASGTLGVWVIYGQVDSINGWDFKATLALLGVYLSVQALRGLFIGPGLEALAGMDGEIWTGKFDFTVLRPLNIQFLVSLRKWRLFALFDLGLGLAVLGIALAQPGVSLTPQKLALFLLAFLAGLLILYAILLIFAALVFWSPGVLFTWLFDGIFQLARFPLGLYPGWLKLLLTWVIPVGLITTLPAEALSGSLNLQTLAGSLGAALLLLSSASQLFKLGLRRYASASS